MHNPTSLQRCTPVLTVRVATREQAAAVRVVALSADADGADGADAAAFAMGYTHKVEAGAGTKYFRDIACVVVGLHGNAASGIATREIAL